jgi:ribonucleoside-diphosphate reductase alpha chain
MSFVTKRDGRKEPMQFDKITERINKLINPIELQSLSSDLSWMNLDKEVQYLDPILVAQKVVGSLYSGITTEELDVESAEICVNLSTTHPSYAYLGGRILVSNLHKKTSNDFVSKMVLLCEAGNINKEWCKWVVDNKDILNSIVNYNMDYVYDYFGYKTLEKSYLLKINNKIIERPQDMLLRTAITLQQGNLELIRTTYEMMSKGYYTHASPTLFNSGSNQMQMSSCFLLGTSDDLSSITNTWNSCAMISKWAGGIGLHVSNIRGKNSLIKGTNGRSNGIVPFLKVFNDIARWIDQGGRRPGSIAIYLEPHHPDIMEFLDLRKNFGSETERARDLFLSLWVSDLFMKQVEADGDWYLLSADECPRLNDTYGDEYETLYWYYVHNKLYRSKISARKLWTHILEAQIETGMPYIAFKDSINHKSNQKNIGIVRSSNLCVHGETQILTSNGYMKIQGLEEKEVNVWNGSEWSKVTVKKTGTNKNLLRVELSNGAYLDCTPEHKFYTIMRDGRSKKHEVMAQDLKVGNKLIKFELPPPIELEKPEKFKYAYTHGFFCGDSNTKKYPKLYLYGEKKLLLNHIESTSYTLNESSDRYDIVLPKDIAPKFSIPFNCSINNKLRWFEGYCDADGTISRNGTNEALQICCIEKEFLVNIRLMLHTLGVESKVTLSAGARQSLLPDGRALGKPTYRLLVSSTGLYKLSKLGFKPHRLVFEEREPQRCAEQFVTVVSVTSSYQNVDTFCFTEPKKHLGMFNGILTGQCCEIVQYSDDKEYAVCNLASISLKPFVVPYKFDPMDEWLVYSKPNCMYCDFAKNYLTNNNVIFKEIPFSNNNLNTLKSVLKATDITFPQIFRKYSNTLEIIGGWNELYNYTKGTFNYDKLYDVAYMATINLNQVIDINYYPVPQTKLSNMKHRPIGLGIQGLADALVLLRTPYDSEKAVEFNAKVMETIYLASVTASNNLAKNRCEMMKQFLEFYTEHKISLPDYYEANHNINNIVANDLYHKLKPNKYELCKDSNSMTIGAYSTFDGSPFSKGIFQFDMWQDIQTELMYKDKWEILREDVVKYGMRNSMLTALMPTASTSQILGNNECFEFFTSNIYSRKTQAGSFILVNKYLVDDMIKVGLWSKEIKDNIIAMNGSIQSLSMIPPQFKHIYKTMWEIKQVWALKGARARSPFVDQTQSMNIFMAEPDYQRLGSSHFWGWKNGLKTGMYYLRTKPASDAIKFTIDPLLLKKQNEEENGCENCSA